MAHLAYLEPDDELTSAAARIRETTGDRVAIVLPFNSRVATSRINFRLLAREAEAGGRILDVIAPDAAGRALAVSAGLRAFATVGEYEAAYATLTAPVVTPQRTDGVAPAADAAPAIPITSATADHLGSSIAPPPAREAAHPSPQTGDRGRSDPKPAGSSRKKASPLALGIILAVAVLLGMGGAAGAMLLPAADITVTAKAEDVPAMTFTVTADHTVAEPDATALKIPARLVELPVQVSGDYSATGKKVTETKATGQVTWTNCDWSNGVTVSGGSLLRTSSGVAFKTTTTVTVGKAKLAGIRPHLTLTCQSANIGVTASVAGVGGNVAAGQITKLPAGFSGTFESVANAAPTRGGTHTETVQIAKADVDAALKDLNARLKTAFEGEVAAPAGLPQGTASYPDTAVLGKATPDTDPATLPGTEVDTFSLSLSATGTILAVDAAPVTAIGEAAVARTITPGYRLVPGSIVVQVGTGVPSDGTVAFAVRASAKRVRMLDAAAFRTMVLGRTEADARAALSQYGTVKISFWPGWVSAVPSNADRVTVTVQNDSPTVLPSSSQSPVPSG